MDYSVALWLWVRQSREVVASPNAERVHSAPECVNCAINISFFFYIQFVKNYIKYLQALYLLSIMSDRMRRMNVRKLPCAGSLEWKRSRRRNYSRIDRSPICDRSEIVPSSLLMQRLMVKLLLLLLIVNFTPILQTVNGVTRTLANTCLEN